MMDDTQLLLEQAAAAADPPEVPFRRLRNRIDQRRRRRAAFAGGTALVVAFAGLALVLQVFAPAFRSSTHPALASGASTHGTFVPRDTIGTLALAPSSQALPDRPGWFVIRAKTNLPEGTRLLYDYEGPNAGGGGCCVVVHNGAVAVRLTPGSCSGSAARFVVTISAMPVNLESHGPPGSFRTIQPQSVLRILGARFQFLTGSMVHVEAGYSVLRARATYSLACPAGR